MRALPKSGEIWVHFKGEDKKYLIITVATHTETHKQFVVYKALYGDFKDYIRPLDMFMSEVDRQKYPDVSQKYRFEKLISINKKILSLRNHLKIGFFYLLKLILVSNLGMILPSSMILYSKSELSIIDFKKL